MYRIEGTAAFGMLIEQIVQHCAHENSSNFSIVQCLYDRICIIYTLYCVNILKTVLYFFVKRFFCHPEK